MENKNSNEIVYTPEMIKFVLYCLGYGVNFGFLDFGFDDPYDKEKIRMLYSIPEKRITKDGDYVKSKDITDSIESYFAGIMSEKFNQNFKKEDFKFASTIRIGETFSDEDAEKIYNELKGYAK